MERIIVVGGHYTSRAHHPCSVAVQAPNCTISSVAVLAGLSTGTAAILTKELQEEVIALAKPLAQWVILARGLGNKYK